MTHLALRMGRAGMLGFTWPSAWVGLGCWASPGPPHGSGWDAGLRLALRMGQAGMQGFWQMLQRFYRERKGRELSSRCFLDFPGTFKQTPEK